MAGPGRWVPMLSIGRQTPEGALGATSWVQLLDSEESLVAAQGFGAGVLVVNYSGELLRHDQKFLDLFLNPVGHLLALCRSVGAA